MEHSQRQDSLPPSKRSRRGNRNQPILSCMECRRMKFKCDRIFPCSNCVKRGLISLCPSGQLDPKAGRYILNSDQALHDRVVDLEKQLLQAKQQLETYEKRENNQARSPQLPIVPTIGNQQLEDVLGGPSTGANVPEMTGMDISRDASELDEGQLTLSEEPGGSRFFGKAAPSYLYASQGGYNTHLPNHPVNHSRSSSLQTSSSHPFPGLPLNPVLTVDEITKRLPLYRVAKELGNVFFEVGSFNIAMIPRTFFDESLLPLAYQVEQPSSLCNQEIALLCLILAIGAQMDTRLPAHNELGESMFGLGRAALAIDPSVSITLIQAVHLMSRYLGNSLKVPHACPSFWPTLGGAIRGALHLGLHRDGRRWNLAEDEVHTRRRIFWEIYYEDILQSMTQGRPKTISECTVDVEKPFAEPSDHDAQFHEHKYHVFHAAARVNDLQCRVSPVSYKTVVDIDEKLRSVEAAFPDLIRYTENGSHRSEIVRHALQKLTLKTYITQSIYFLHRSHFAHALRYHPQEPLVSPYNFVSELEASRVLLQVLRDAMALDAGRACRIWGYWFHAFNAIICFAATVIRSPASSLANAILVHIEDGVAMFERVPKGYTAHEDLPVLYRLLAAAREALATHTTSDHDGKQSLEILAIGTRLVRSMPTESAIRTSDRATMFSGGETPIDLPTTIEAAVRDQREYTKHLNTPANDIDSSDDPEWAMNLATAAGPDLLSSAGDFDFDAFINAFGS